MKVTKMTKNGSKNPLLGSKTGVFNPKARVSENSVYEEYLEHIFFIFRILYFPYHVIIKFIFRVLTLILIENSIMSSEVRALARRIYYTDGNLSTTSP